MDIVRPGTSGEMAVALRQAAESGKTVRLGGSFTKDGMGGPAVAGDVRLTTCAMTRVLQYEPKDLTISVEAGMPWARLSELLAQNGQMIPLDPPFFDHATVGGVLAANTCGPRRRLYGTARDVVIGMEFATLGGKVVQSGGMVVKNVAGLDMAKLLIGSFGTLAAITSANFKLTPCPESSATWVLRFDNEAAPLEAAARIRAGVLRPSALDILNPEASDRIGVRGWTLLIEAGGVPAVLGRYSRELADAAIRLAPDEATRLWTAVRELIPGFLTEHPDGSVLRITTPLKEIGKALRRYPGSAALCRAGSGVTWVCAESQVSVKASADAVLEFAPESVRASSTLWEPPKPVFDVMKELKGLFDPKGLLNPGRLYGRI
ncbi:MAG: FAD-binding oxidoreductase [Bryobacteraceae bacterium]|nr:FAD-binding oxidoreductase [Bryobacteraceae bacterium]